MFALFFSLYVSLFSGSWYLFQRNDIVTAMQGTFNKLGEFITSLFNNTSTPVVDLGDVLFDEFYIYPNYITLVSFILALITSIGIVFAAGKVLKKIFGVFFVLGR